MNSPLTGGEGRRRLLAAHHWRHGWRAFTHWLGHCLAPPVAHPPELAQWMTADQTIDSRRGPPTRRQQARITDVAELVQISYAMARLAKQERRFGVVSQPQAQRLYQQSVALLAHDLNPALANGLGSYDVVTQFNFQHGGVSGVVFYQASTGQVVATLDGTNDPVEWLTDLATALDRYSLSRLKQASEVVTAALSWTPPILPSDPPLLTKGGAVLIVGHSLGGQDAQLGTQQALLQMKLAHPNVNQWHRTAVLKFDPLNNPGLENNTSVGGVSLAAVQPRQAILTADPGVVSTLYPQAKVYAIPDPVGRAEPSRLNPVAWAKYHHQMLRYTQCGGRIDPIALVETVLQGQPLAVQVPAAPDPGSIVRWLSVPLEQISDTLNSPWRRDE